MSRRTHGHYPHFGHELVDEYLETLHDIDKSRETNDASVHRLREHAAHVESLGTDRQVPFFLEEHPHWD